MFGNCAVEQIKNSKSFYLLSLKDKVFKTELDKKILLERNDYIIRNSIMDGWESFGGQYKFAMRIYMATILNFSKRN